MYDGINQGLETKPAIRNIVTGPNSTKFQSSNNSLLIGDNTRAELPARHHNQRREASKETKYGEIIIDDYGVGQEEIPKVKKDTRTNGLTINSFFPSSSTLNIAQASILKKQSELRRNVSNAMNIEDDDVNMNNFHYGGCAAQGSTAKNRTRKANGLSGGNPV